MVDGLMVAAQGTFDRNASPTLPLFGALHKITAIKLPTLCDRGKKEIYLNRLYGMIKLFCSVCFDVDVTTQMTPNIAAEKLQKSWTIDGNDRKTDNYWEIKEWKKFKEVTRKKVLSQIWAKNVFRANTNPIQTLHVGTLRDRLSNTIRICVLPTKKKNQRNLFWITVVQLGIWQNSLYSIKNQDRVLY